MYLYESMRLIDFKNLSQKGFVKLLCLPMCLAQRFKRLGSSLHGDGTTGSSGIEPLSNCMAVGQRFAWRDALVMDHYVYRCAIAHRFARRLWQTALKPLESSKTSYIFFLRNTPNTPFWNNNLKNAQTNKLKT